MNSIKDTVKDNLVRLRREHKLTQLELSARINYSDKAISRWETGEVTPDVETLAYLAEIYEISITAFFLPAEGQLSKKERRAHKAAMKLKRKAEKKEKKLQKSENARKASALERKTSAQKRARDPQRERRIALLVFALSFLWAAALSLFFIFLNTQLRGAWHAFIWAVPATFLILLVFFRAGRHRTTRAVFLSLFVWTVLVATYLQVARWSSFFPILFLGIPLQAVILLSPYLRKKK